MTRLIVAILAVAGLWMAWWAFGSIAHEKALKAWIEDRRGEGWAAEVTALDVRGFPNRFDTTIEQVLLADPETGIAWEAPFVQFLSLAYKPHQVIVVPAETHVFSTPFQAITISHQNAKASVFMEPSTSLALESGRVVAEELQLSSTLGWKIALAEGRFAVEQAEGRVATYRLGAELLEFLPTEATRRLLDPAGILPERLEQFRVDADLGFTDKWDRRAIEVARPQVTELDLRDLSARWGDVTFQAAGDLVVDAQGYPEGRIAIRAVEWRRILDMAVASGLLLRDFVPALESALGLMAGLSGSPDTLDADLVFENGSMSFGLIPLGPAPRWIIR